MQLTKSGSMEKIKIPKVRVHENNSVNSFKAGRNVLYSIIETQTTLWEKGEGMKSDLVGLEEQLDEDSWNVSFKLKEEKVQGREKVKSA